MSAVHREADEHRSLGRVSRVSAKKGGMSGLLYDTVQEAALKQTLLMTTMDVVT